MRTPILVPLNDNKKRYLLCVGCKLEQVSFINIKGKTRSNGGELRFSTAIIIHKKRSMQFHIIGLGATGIGCARWRQEGILFGTDAGSSSASHKSKIGATES
jgi:hypothetical protein